MTVQELIDLVNDKFLFEPATDNLLKHAEDYATRIVRENWPEVHSVTAEYGGEHSISLNVVFHSQQDYVWWKLKYG